MPTEPTTPWSNRRRGEFPQKTSVPFNRNNAETAKVINKITKTIFSAKPKPTRCFLPTKKTCHSSERVRTRTISINNKWNEWKITAREVKRSRQRWHNNNGARRSSKAPRRYEKRTIGVHSAAVSAPVCCNKPRQSKRRTGCKGKSEAISIGDDSVASKISAAQPNSSAHIFLERINFLKFSSARAGRAHLQKYFNEQALFYLCFFGFLRDKPPVIWPA